MMWSRSAIRLWPPANSTGRLYTRPSWVWASTTTDSARFGITTPPMTISFAGSVLAAKPTTPAAKIMILVRLSGPRFSGVVTATKLGAVCLPMLIARSEPPDSPVKVARRSVATGDGDGDGDGVGDGVGNGVGVGIGVGDGVGDGEGVGFGDGEGEGDGDGVGIGVGVGVGVGVGTANTTKCSTVNDPLTPASKITGQKTRGEKGSATHDCSSVPRELV